MTTDYRALCVELLEALENAIRVIHHEDGTRHISTADAVIAKADAALAQPEPQGPTDEEILALSQEHGVSYTRLNGGVIYPRPEGYDIRDDVLSFARAVLARWGQPTTPETTDEQP